MRFLAAVLTGCVLASCGGGSGGGGGGGGTTLAFNVGGSISGLGNSSGLVLDNSGGEKLAIGANATSFIFATKLAQSKPYVVSISSQPQGVTCTVRNGSGTMGTSDVTSVAVDCALPMFNVGGSISRLGNSSGLVLDNSGGEKLAIGANATNFIFAAKLAQSRPYVVSISSQPQGATCAVRNGSGTMGSNDVTSVAVDCTPQIPAAPYTVTTVAGDDGQTLVDGTGTAARFDAPGRTAVDSAGNVYVSDSGSNAIRKVSPSGEVTTLAGGGPGALVDAIGTAARFWYPQGLAVDGAGNVYVADYFNHAIRKISPSGEVTTLAGSTTGGLVDASGTAARFRYPISVATDSAGNVYVADYRNHAIRKISPSGVVTTLAGNGTLGFVDGTGAAARFSSPTTLAVDAGGNVYVTDQGDTALRKITPSGAVTTVTTSLRVSSVVFDQIGNLYGLRLDDPTNGSIVKLLPNGQFTTLTLADGTAPRIAFGGLSVDRFGNFYGAESVNRLIRKLSLSGGVTTLAGQGPRWGLIDGIGVAARFFFPTGVGVDSAGNAYVADQGNHAIRKVSPSGVVTTLAGNGTAGFQDGVGPDARFKSPGSTAVDGAGNVYIADTGNHAIRKLSPDGTVITLAGNGVATLADGTTLARFSSPSGVAVDRAGNVYVADQGNQAIRKVSPDGLVSTFAGGGGRGLLDETGIHALFSDPAGVAVDSANNVYVADSHNHAIRKISPSGVVSTLARICPNCNGYGFPISVAVDSAGSVYVGETYMLRDVPGSSIVRKVSPAGVVTIVAGDIAKGYVNGAGVDARFMANTYLAVDSAGNVYIGDTWNHAIRKMVP